MEPGHFYFLSLFFFYLFIIIFFIDALCDNELMIMAYIFL